MQALHSFYKAHNLPYLEKYAQFDAQQIKELFQPKLSEIQKMIEQDDQNLKTMYQNAQTRNAIGMSLAALLAIGFYCYRN